MALLTCMLRLCATHTCGVLGQFVVFGMLDVPYALFYGGAGVVGGTRVGCRENLLNLSANQRSQARIVRATLVVLARPLSCLG